MWYTTTLKKSVQQMELRLGKLYYKCRLMQNLINIICNHACYLLSNNNNTSLNRAALPLGFNS